jgi:transcriptional regulator with XRE-family HTH domain
MSDDPKFNDVAQKLRSIQNHYGYTLQEMADNCGMPKWSLENYMRLKNPQRPGLDALKSLADGLNVSIDWLLGRVDERFAPELTTEDYALFCHSVVLRLPGQIVTAASERPEAFDAKLYTIDGVSTSDISAAAMHVVQRQGGNPNTPKEYGIEQFRSIGDSDISERLPQHVEDILASEL